MIRLLAILLLLSGVMAQAQQLDPNGFPLSALSGNEIIECESLASPYITTCTPRQLANFATNGVTISGTPVVGYVPIATSPTTAAWGTTFPVTMTFSAPFNVSTPTYGILATSIATNSTNPLTGTSGIDVTVNGLTVQVDHINAGANTVRGFNVYHNFGSSAAFGNRIGSQFSLEQTTPTAITNTARAYTAVETFIGSDQGDGGSGVGSTAGSYWALNPYVRLGASAVFTTEASGSELNTELLVGSSTLDKYGYKVVQIATDAVAGSRNDAAYFAGNAAGAIGWKAIFQIGDTLNVFPLQTSGSIMLVKGSPTFAHGIDFTGATCSLDCFKSPGMVIDGGGNFITNGTTIIGNNVAIPVGGSIDEGYRFSSVAHFGIFFGSGTPSLSAAKGSLYLRSDGAQNARLYINTDGGTTWTAFNTAS